MTEIQVKQRTKEWFELRRSVVLTASRFGDALGVGKGKPYDFLVSLISEDLSTYQSDENNVALRHGTFMEVVIREAYQLLTGYQTRETGFWIPVASDPLNGIIGVSPDDLVMCGRRHAARGMPCISGLAEYKAPLHRLYTNNGSNVIHGIPRHYMAQIQGQMAVTQMPWSDFMAVCVKTRELMLKRIYFQPVYWAYVSSKLAEFASIVQEARQLKKRGVEPLNSEDIRSLKDWSSIESERPPGEGQIKVVNLVETDNRGRYKGPSGHWLTFDLLVGTDITLPSTLRAYATDLIQEIDEDIELAAIEGL